MTANLAGRSCIGCGSYLGPTPANDAEAFDARTLCDACALDELAVARLAAGWAKERRHRELREAGAGAAGVVREAVLNADDDLLILTGLEALDVLDGLLDASPTRRIATTLAKFREAFRACGPHGQALAEAVRVGAIKGLHRLHDAGTREQREEIRVLRERLERTEKSLEGAEWRAIRSQQLCDERFRRLADDVRTPQPN